MPARSPTVAASIHDLELAARMVVEGLRAGGHKSPFHGYSAEFQQHRPYRAGDDLKYLDWKILARTDRLYTRLFRETTSMSVMIVLDASASMSYPEGPEGDVSKFDYARVLAASLAWLIATQGDAVGLMTLAETSFGYLPARGGRPHLRSLLARLERLEPAGVWRPERVIARSAELLKRRGLLIVLSDFYDAEDETRRELRRAARRGHDVTMLQIISRAELDFPFRGDVEFRDLESGEHRLVDTAATERDYRMRFAHFAEQCRAHAHRDGIDYALLPTDVAPERALRAWLIRRAAPV